MSGNTSVTPSLNRATGDVYDGPERVPDVGVGDTVAESPIQSYGDAIATSDSTDWNPVTDQERINQLDQVLTDMAEGLADDLELPFPDSLRQRLVEWCNLHGVDSPKDPSTVEIITQQAVFNILLKATLYEWYHKRGDLPPLTGDIRERFRHAKNETEDDAFDEYVLDEVTWHADPDTLAPIIDSRTTLLRSGRPAEDIGKLYKAVIPSEQRKTLGQFRTPLEIADVMRRWADTDADILLDPGMGPAVLSSPGYPNLTVSTDPDEVHGIDRSQLARLMGTVTLTLVGQARHLLRPEGRSLSVDSRSGLRGGRAVSPVPVQHP